MQWIGLRPEHEAPMRVVLHASALLDRGLDGDRVARRAGGKRQVTLIQAEHLPALAALTGHAQIPPEWLRRNLVVSGLNLVALKKLRFAIGDEVVLEGTGPCEPCMKLEARLGEGAYHAMRGHGGITAKILRGGALRVGDEVRALPPG